jgi:hypothetical protein
MFTSGDQSLVGEITSSNRVNEAGVALAKGYHSWQGQENILFSRVQTGSGTHPASYQMGTPAGKAAGP